MLLPVKNLANSKVSNRAFEFLSFAYQAEALKFGEFTLNSGRVSPYFLNTGKFSNGRDIFELARFYSAAINENIPGKFMLFGPAYKGIPLATSTALSLYRDFGRSTPYAFDRKEIKDHGEGGWTVGAPLSGRVVIVEDVITSGMSIDKAVGCIRSHGADPIAAVISLDRMEVSGDSECSAVENVQRKHDIDVIAVATVTDLLDFVKLHDQLESFSQLVQSYLDRYVPKPS